MTVGQHSFVTRPRLAKLRLFFPLNDSPSRRPLGSRVEAPEERKGRSRCLGPRTHLEAALSFGCATCGQRFSASALWHWWQDCPMEARTMTQSQVSRKCPQQAPGYRTRCWALRARGKAARSRVGDHGALNSRQGPPPSECGPGVVGGTGQAAFQEASPMTSFFFGRTT